MNRSVINQWQQDTFLHTSKKASCRYLTQDRHSFEIAKWIGMNKDKQTGLQRISEDKIFSYFSRKANCR